MGPTSAENEGDKNLHPRPLVSGRTSRSERGRCRHTPGCGGPAVLCFSKASCGVDGADQLGITGLESSGQSLAGCTFSDLDGQDSNPYFQLRQASSEDPRTRGWSGAGTQTSHGPAGTAPPLTQLTFPALPPPAPHCWHVPSKCCSLNTQHECDIQGH